MAASATPFSPAGQAATMSATIGPAETGAALRETLMTDAPGPEAEYRAHLAQGRIMLQRSASSGEFMFPPRTAASGTGARDLEWVEASGRGTVYSTTVSRRRPEQGGALHIALIEMEEGPRMMSRVEGLEPEAVAIGLKVKARIAEVLGDLAVVWEPAEGEA